MKHMYQFYIEVSNGNWRKSPEYPTQEECFAGALRCAKKLNKQFQRITFAVNECCEEQERKV